MSRRVAATLVVASIALGGASLALASPGDDATLTVSDFTVSFNDDEGDQASCPPKTTATGGGFGSVTPPPQNTAINVSGPVDKTELPGQTRTGDRARGWSASVYSGNPAAEDMKVFAVCSASSDARLMVASFSVPPAKTRSKVVSCPKGQRALGGGLDIATAPISGVYMESSGPLSAARTAAGTDTGDSPRAWGVAAYNGFSVTRRFQALVICSKTLKPQIVADEVPVSSSNDVEVAADCPPGQRALGGGVLVLGKPTAELQITENGPLASGGTTATTNDGDVPVAWDGDVYNRLQTTRSYKTLAVCA